MCVKIYERNYTSWSYSVGVFPTMCVLCRQQLLAKPVYSVNINTNVCVNKCFYIQDLCIHVF